MPSISQLASWEALILLAGLFGVILWKCISGEIVLDGLFEGDMKAPKSRAPENQDEFSTHISVGRIQVFWITLCVAYSYLAQVVQDPSQLPALPDSTVALLAGSHALYLGGKAQAMFLGPLRNILK